MSDSIFDPILQCPIKEDFKDHTLVVELPAGEGEQPVVKTECHNPNSDQNMCDVRHCQVKDLIATVGAWDVIRAAGDIELTRLSGRIDWSDPEEPWLDVEP